MNSLRFIPLIFAFGWLFCRAAQSAEHKIGSSQSKHGAARGGGRDATSANIPKSGEKIPDTALSDTGEDVGEVEGQPRNALLISALSGTVAAAFHLVGTWLLHRPTYQNNTRIEIASETINYINHDHNAQNVLKLGDIKFTNDQKPILKEGYEIRIISRGEDQDPIVILVKPTTTPTPVQIPAANGSRSGYSAQEPSPRRSRFAGPGAEPGWGPPRRRADWAPRPIEGRGGSARGSSDRRTRKFDRHGDLHPQMDY